jgi:hypothetical protein
MIGRYPWLHRNALIAFPAVLLIGLGLAFAGSQTGTPVFGVPIFTLCVGLAFLIHWLAFIPAFLLQTEKFYELTGSISYAETPILIPHL